MFMQMRIILLLVLLIWVIGCDNPSESITTTVRIDDVWIDDFVDTDNDGFYSDANLYFNIRTNTNDLDVFVQLGIRENSDNPDDLYDLCFESTDLSLDKDKDNIWFIPLRNIDYHLQQNNYDFLLHLYKSENPQSIADEITPSDDDDFDNIALESDSTDLVKQWISYIDDDIIESYFTYYPRIPTGASYVSLAEKFEKPTQAGYLKLFDVRIYVPTIYNNPTTIGMSIRSNNNDEPDEILGSYLLETETTGWNQFTWEYDLTEHNVFYITVGPSVHYAVGLDTNSVNRNGYGLWTTSANPPTSYWNEWNSNIAIEVFVGYSLINGLAKLNPAAKLCRRRY